MSQPRKSVARLAVRHIGGITATEIELRPGVTALVGQNATNRTSLLQSIIAVCGGSDVSIRGDAEAGHVELELDGDTYSRTLRRCSGTIAASGEALLADPRAAELFAFLLESNPVRRAVARGDPLRDLIMEPVDTEDIEQEIARLRAEKREIEDELESIADRRTRLPRLEERQEQLDDQIEARRQELAEKRDQLALSDEQLDQDPRNAELDEQLEQLSEKRTRLEEVRSDRDIEEATIEEIRNEIEELEAERDELPAAPEETITEIDRQIEFVREQKRDAEASMNDLQRIIQFNEEMIGGANIKLLEDRVADDESPSVTDQLVEDERVVCWTCGTEVEKQAIESTLDRLRRVRRDELEKAGSLDDRLDELEAKRDQLEQQRQRKAAIDRKLDSLRSELAESERRVERLDTRITELADDIAEIEADVERLQDQAHSELLAVQEAVDELEFELERLREEREQVEAQRERIEERLTDQEELEAKRETLQEAITEQRTRIERIEEEAVEQFNAQMEDLLDLLGYDNIDRIWLESREMDDERVFELHVVRTTEAGATYEDTVDHLSESEREVTSLVFALAGYLAHDVYEDFPFLLLDSLEAIDAQRLASLIEYVSDYAEYVVTALLPEDARALDDDFDRITDI
ncbi:MAG: archaea-specific SMC-related protein [Halorhabdus sp.]